MDSSLSWLLAQGAPGIFCRFPALELVAADLSFKWRLGRF